MVVECPAAPGPYAASPSGVLLKVRRVDVLTHLMFQDGRAREAAEWYVSLVPGSRVGRVVDNGAGGATVYFTLAGREFIAFDSPVRHEFDFTPSTSIFVRCESDEQVRGLFERLAAEGAVLMPVDDYGFSSCFGWAADRYGVSWQVGKADPDHEL
jgi:predicted 3-demethylubiquinone-9 3-methyltransferase (glyoxalase superfamily)